MSLRRVSVLLLATLLALAGCTPPPRPTPPVPWTAQQLLQRLAEQSERFQALKGTARLRVTTPERSDANTLALVLARPDRLRADLLSPFGQPLLQLAARDDLLSAYVPGRREAYRGPATATSLYRFTRLPLQLTDLVAFCLDAPPVLPHRRAATAAEEGEWRLWLDGDSGRRQALVFDSAGRVTAARYYQQQTLLLAVSYGDFSAAAAGDFPQRIRIDLPQESTRAELHFRRVQTPQTVDASIFRLQWPAGVTVQPLPQ